MSSMKTSNGLTAVTPTGDSATSLTPGDDAAAGDDLPALSSAFRGRIRPVLNRIDQLRTHGLQSELKLPMIAVVGDQSVGKSSVLEAISGVEFPRGTGIVTRCALQLSMRNCGPESAWEGVIKYKTIGGERVEKVMHDPKEMDPEVREAQKKMTRSEGEISNEQIDVVIRGSTVPDLTLIDLPGIARYSATEGTAIAQQTKSLISKYIAQPQVLILVVVPCHQDIETVEALSLAKDADPTGERTIGVMTCPDMVNKGAEQETMLIATNSKIPLKKGYVMVKCRSPQELKEGVTLAQSVANEEIFFRAHKHFCELPERSVGVRNLAEKLTEELYFSIKKNISVLQADILELRKRYQDELQALGPPVAQSKDERRRRMFEMLTNFSKDVTIATQGEMSGQFHLYAKCRRHWEKLAETIKKACPAWVLRSSSNIYWNPPSHITALIVDLRGRELSNYDYVFPIIERVYRTEFLEKLRDPATIFLEQVAEEVTNVVRDIAAASFHGFQDIVEVVVETSNDEIAKVLEAARLDLHERLFKQEARVFSQDRLFLLKMGKLEENLYKSQQPNIKPDQPPPLPDSAEKIRRGVEAYLEIAIERLCDIIPQSVLYYLFDVLARQLGNRALELVSDADTADTFIGLLREEKYKTSRRKQLDERLEQLRLAQRDFNKFRLDIG